jgi:hypothetical protein
VFGDPVLGHRLCDLFKRFRRRQQLAEFTRDRSVGSPLVGCRSGFLFRVGRRHRQLAVAFPPPPPFLGIPVGELFLRCGTAEPVGSGQSASR